MSTPETPWFCTGCGSEMDNAAVEPYGDGSFCHVVPRPVVFYGPDGREFTDYEPEPCGPVCRGPALIAELEATNAEYPQALDGWLVDGKIPAAVRLPEPLLRAVLERGGVAASAALARLAERRRRRSGR